MNIENTIDINVAYDGLMMLSRLIYVEYSHED